MKRLLPLLLLFALVLTSLTGCVSGDPAVSAKRLTKAGYDVKTYETEASVGDALFFFGIDGAGTDTVVAAFDRDSACPLAFVYVVYCQNNEAASYVLADSQAFIKNDLDRYLTYGEEDGGFTKADFTAVQKGKIVLFGLKSMIKVAS